MDAQPSPSLALVLLAAGAGTRLGGGVPKALRALAGVPLVRRAAEALLAGAAEAGRAATLVVVVPPDPGGRSAVEAALVGLPCGPIYVSGGARRRDSVRAGIEAAVGAELVLVHDAARCLVTPAVVARVADAAARDGAAIPAIPVPDTLVRDAGGHVGEEVPRAGVQAVQTPQGFVRALLVAAHAAAPADWDAPDDGTMVRALGRPVALVAGDAENIKITYPADFARGAAILAARRAATGGDAALSGAGEGTMDEGTEGAAPGGSVREAGAVFGRIGFGWDVHPFEPGRPTVLCGVVLTEEFGPKGHSDGDPLAHAVCDALFGAAALGDIGTHFPDTDPRWKGAAGLDLLARTVAILAEHGLRPLQVDAVLVCDAPKIGPFREAVRERLGAVLGVAADRVSLKGKRTEGLGGLSGTRGIACHAVVQVVGR